MDYAIIHPGGALAPFVATIEAFSGLESPHTREKLLPDGTVQLIVDLGERPKKLFAGDTDVAHVAYRRAWISGMQLRPIVIEAQPGASLLVVTFRPGGAYPLLGHDLSAIAGDVAAFEDVVGTAAAGLRDRVLEAPSLGDALLAAEGWLGERLAGREVHPAIRHLVRRLQAPLGLRIGDVAAETGYSGRQLQSLFARWIGVSPKQYARVRRFRQVLSALAESGTTDVWLGGQPLPRANWARVAADLCFSDQSHLAHEFRAFAAMTPGDYLAAYRGLENYLPITVAADRS